LAQRTQQNRAKPEWETFCCKFQNFHNAFLFFYGAFLFMWILWPTRQLLHGFLDILAYLPR
jgi:hypothetical protein